MHRTPLAPNHQLYIYASPGCYPVQLPQRQHRAHSIVRRLSQRASSGRSQDEQKLGTDFRQEHTSLETAEPCSQENMTRHTTRRFRAASCFFVSQADHNAVELPRKKNDFLSLFKEDAEKIEAFMKKEKLGNKSKEDLIKIFEFYNSF